MELFEFISRIRGLNGDGPDGKVHDAAGLNALMRADPLWGREHRAWIEFLWRDPGRVATEQWMRLLVDAARYLSDLVGGDVPLLAPRDVVEASVGLRRGGDEALLIGKAVQRGIATQVERETEIRGEAILEEIRRLLGDASARPIPLTAKWLTTRDISMRLGISEATAERKCRSGEIDADKTGGNQWRTTEDRLRRSPYLNSKKRRGRGNGKLE